MATASTRKPLSKAMSLLIPVTGGALGFAAYCIFTGNEKFYRAVVMPVSFKCFPDAEHAHRIAVKMCSRKLFPACTYSSDRLHTELFGLKFSNPLGLAAGFDKQGECVEGAFHSGFGFTEIGSVTPLAQPGNDQPRVFRLLSDEAVINRYGFNSDGFDQVFARLAPLLKTERPGPMGVNLGKNKQSAVDSDDDYVNGVQKFGRIADYLVINVSSPNTPGLRDYQKRASMLKLLQRVAQARDMLIVPRRVPILVKIAPDLSQQDKTDIANVVQQLPPGTIDGIIVGNTTTTRPPDLPIDEAGGLSGRPLRPLALRTLKDMYRLTRGSIPLIGCGGISDGRDAYERLRAGASLIQIYTAMIFQGPPVVRRILRELDELLAKDGFSNITQVIGLDAYAEHDGYAAAPPTQAAILQYKKPAAQYN